MSAPHVTVVGAGVVGVCSALYLRLRGAEVTVVDRDEPGAGCSSGNAGMLGTASCVPTALPGVIRKVPAMLRAPDSPLGLPVSMMPRLAPWLARFVLAARPKRVEAISAALASLQRELLPAWQELLDAAGAADLVRRPGKLHAFETDVARRALDYPLSLQREHGVAFEELGPEEVLQLAPALGAKVRGGIFYPDVGHSIDPKRMIERLAEHFVERGGRIVRDEVRAIETGAEGAERLVTASGTMPIRTLLICAGVWSGAFARSLGTKVPLETQRGYHVMLPRPGIELRLPIKCEERKIIATPMAGGLRLTGIAEFGRPEDPPNPARADVVLAAGRGLFPGLDSEGGVTWMGNRPCTPDSMPVLDRSPRHPNVYFAFGHGHLGLGLGAISGRLMAELILAGKADPRLAAFGADRFGPALTTRAAA